MTIVVWDGKTLAADRMSSRSSADRTGAAEEHCTSESTKLILFPTKPNFSGDQLLACGYAGSVDQFSAFHAAIFRDLKNPKVDKDIDFYDRLNIVIGMQLTAPDISALYLLGDKRGRYSVYTVEWAHGTRRAWKATARVTPHHPGTLAVIGSGRQSTKVFSTKLALTSEQYVHLATKYAEGCGHGMDLFQPGWAKTRRLTEISEEAKQDIFDKFAASL